MKPMEGAAWDITPETYPMVNEPGSEQSQHFQPDCHCPEFWPGNVMGFDYTGGAIVRPAMDQLPAGSPGEARTDRQENNPNPPVDYDRLSKGLPIKYTDRGVPVRHTEK